MKKVQKITLVSVGSLVATTLFVVPITLTAISYSSISKNNGSTLINKPIIDSGQINGNQITEPAKVESIDGARIKIREIFSDSRSTEQKYELTLVNNDEKGEVNFVDDNGQNIGKVMEVVRGQQVHVKVNVKPEYQDTLTVVNFWVYDVANPNCSLGVTKVDDNNYHFTMPDGEFADDFYVSGELKASITYGQKTLGAWEFDFKSKTYVLNITEDNFVFDDVANPNLKMQQYPQTNSFVVYSMRLNGHNVIIKNMTIPKNVQFEVLNDYSVFNEQTTENSPVLGFAEDGKLVQNGAAGLWRGVRLTKRTLSEFNWSSWGQDENILIVGDEFNKLPLERK